MSLPFINAFISQYLDGDIEGLCDFPLSRLREDKVFGCRGRNFDPDDTEIMRHIYVVLFSEVWPDLSMEALKDGVFRGDTLNTYNTLFGSPERYTQSDALRSKVEEFRLKFTTIGNMVVLPNIRVGRESINTYRGKHGKWHDYFDRFLVALRDTLTGQQSQDAKLADLIATNAQYFAPYQGESGFRTLVDRLLLSDYVDANYIPVVSSKGYYYWRTTLTQEEYESEAIRYIDFASSVINHRAAFMVDRLTHIFK